MPELFNADFIDFINNNKKKGTNLDFLLNLLQFDTKFIP